MDLLPKLYTDVAEALDSGEEVPSQVSAAIAYDISMRRTNVESYAPTVVLLPWWIRVLLHSAILAGVGAVAALAFSRSTFWGLSWVAIMLFVARMTWKSIPMYRACARSIRGQCDNCAYDLASLPDAIPQSRANGVSLGPRRCPECGVDWPRVPRLGGSLAFAALHTPPRPTPELPASRQPPLEGR